MVLYFTSCACALLSHASCTPAHRSPAAQGFFDFWLVFLVHEVRRLVRGPEVADALRERVVSKAGASRPVGVRQASQCAADGGWEHVDVDVQQQLNVMRIPKTFAGCA